MKKKEESKTVKVDFTRVMVEVEYDEFKEVDLHKVVGNNIHKGCADLEIDEIGRAVFREGAADIPVECINDIRAIIQSSPLVFAYRMAVLALLPKQITED